MSNMTPNDKPPRLFRRQPPEFFPASDVVSLLSADENILHINAEVYDQLVQMDRHRVLRTDKTVLSLHPRRFEVVF